MGMIESDQELRGAQAAITQVAEQTGKPYDYINTLVVAKYKSNMHMGFNLVEWAYIVRDEILAKQG